MRQGSGTALPGKVRNELAAGKPSADAHDFFWVKHNFEQF